MVPYGSVSSGIVLMFLCHILLFHKVLYGLMVLHDLIRSCMVPYGLVWSHKILI